MLPWWTNNPVVQNNSEQGDQRVSESALFDQREDCSLPENKVIYGFYQKDHSAKFAFKQNQLLPMADMSPSASSVFCSA